MKTGNTLITVAATDCGGWASMEPGHEDREYACITVCVATIRHAPQWSPVMKTGNTRRTGTREHHGPVRPQWSPVMKTGNTSCPRPRPAAGPGASMEPGHEDREYGHLLTITLTPQQKASMEPGHEDREYRTQNMMYTTPNTMPQWSPVMKTGNTADARVPPDSHRLASMEPGHEDREYHEWEPQASQEEIRLNGARS